MKTTIKIDKKMSAELGVLAERLSRALPGRQTKGSAVSFLVSQAKKRGYKKVVQEALN